MRGPPVPVLTVMIPEGALVRVPLLTVRLEAQLLAIKPGPVDDAAHLARVVLGLLLLLVVPGLVAMDWLGLHDLPVRLALVPGMSIALVTAAGILVSAVHRGAFGVVDGWASLALALVMSGRLLVVTAALSMRRTRPGCPITCASSCGCRPSRSNA